MSSKTKKTKTVLRSTVTLVIKALQDLPDLTADLANQAKAIEAMKLDLTSAIAHGYSYSTIAKILSDNGITINPATLQRQLTIANKDKPPAMPPSSEKPNTTDDGTLALSYK